MTLLSLLEFRQANPKFAQEGIPSEYVAERYYNALPENYKSQFKDLDSFKKAINYDEDSQIFETPKERSYVGELGAGIARGGVGVVKDLVGLADFAARTLKETESSDDPGAWIRNNITLPVLEDLDTLQKNPSIRASIEAQEGGIKSISGLTSLVGEAVPSLAAFLLPSGAASAGYKAAMLAGNIDKAAKALKYGRLASAALGIGLEAGGGAEEYRDLENQAASLRRAGQIAKAEEIEGRLTKVNDALRVSGGALAGILEAASGTAAFEKVFGLAGAASAKEALRSRILKEVPIGVLREGGTEAIQQVVGNFFAEQGIDPSRKLVDGVVESLVVGGILGAGGGISAAAFPSDIDAQDVIKNSHRYTQGEELTQEEKSSVPQFIKNRVAEDKVAEFTSEKQAMAAREYLKTNEDISADVRLALNDRLDKEFPMSPDERLPVSQDFLATSTSNYDLPITTQTLLAKNPELAKYIPSSTGELSGDALDSMLANKKTASPELIAETEQKLRSKLAVNPSLTLEQRNKINEFLGTDKKTTQIPDRGPFTNISNWDELQREQFVADITNKIRNNTATTEEISVAQRIKPNLMTQVTPNVSPISDTQQVPPMGITLPVQNTTQQETVVPTTSEAPVTRVDFEKNEAQIEASIRNKEANNQPLTAWEGAYKLWSEYKAQPPVNEFEIFKTTQALKNTSRDLQTYSKATEYSDKLNTPELKQLVVKDPTNGKAIISGIESGAITTQEQATHAIASHYGGNGLNTALGMLKKKPINITSNTAQTVKRAVKRVEEVQSIVGKDSPVYESLQVMKEDFFKEVQSNPIAEKNFRNIFRIKEQPSVQSVPGPVKTASLQEQNIPESTFNEQGIPKNTFDEQGIPKTSLKDQTGRAFFLEDIASAVYKTGQSFAQFVSEMKTRLGELYTQVKDKLRSIFDTLVEANKKILDERGSIPVMPTKNISIQKVATSVKDYDPSNPIDIAHVSKRINDSKQNPADNSLWKRITDKTVATYRSFKEPIFGIDPNRFGNLSNLLRKLKDVRAIAQDEVIRGMKTYLGHLNHKEKTIFGMRIMLGDLYRDIEKGRYGYSTEQELNDSVLKNDNGEVLTFHYKGDAEKYLNDSGLDTTYALYRYADGQLQPADTKKGKWTIAKKAYKGLPFGFSEDADGNLLPASVAFENVRRNFLTHKRLVDSDKRLKDAYNKRIAFTKGIKEQLVANGIVNPAVLNDDDYFHHQVLLYINGVLGPKSRGSKMNPKTPFTNPRTGSIEDYNTNYLQSEYKVWTDAIVKLQTKRILDFMQMDKTSNHYQKLVDEAKKRNQDDPKGKWTWQKVLDEENAKRPEGERLVHWEPSGHDTFSMGSTIAERVMDSTIPLEERLEILNSTDKIKRNFVLDESNYKVLTSFGNVVEDEGLAKLSASFQAKWKNWILLNPMSIIKYNLNNFSGDLDIALAYDPRIASPTRLKRMLSILKKVNNGEALSANEAEFWKRSVEERVVDSDFSTEEMHYNDVGVENFLRGGEEATNAIAKAKKYVGNTADFMKAFTRNRENLLRLAAFDYFLENQDKQLYGASVVEQIDDIQDPVQRAAKLARELIGDYGNVSHAGKWIRKHVIPFFSWLEINAPRYVRLIRNTRYEEGGMGRVGMLALTKGAKLGVKMGLLMAAVMLYNKTFFPEEDKELESSKSNKQTHLILGRTADGEIRTISFNGAMGDILDWLSLSDPVKEVEDLRAGKETFAEKTINAWKHIASKAFNMSSPFYKAGVEQMLGVSMYPDSFNPIPIRNRAEHLARLFGLGMPAKQVLGLPNRGFTNELENILTYTENPGEVAYFETRNQVNKYLERTGQAPPRTRPTTKQNTLALYKQAIKYGDLKAAEKYYNKYMEMGGKKESVKVSIEKAHPLSSLPNKDRKKFLGTLSYKEQQKLQRAISWWRETYGG